MIYFWCRQKVFQIMAQYWTQLFQFQPHLRLQFQYQNTQRNGDGSNATHSPVSRLLFSTTLNYTSTTLFEFEKWEVEELLLEQTSFGISGLWWCSSPLSHPAVITGLVLSWLPVGERDKGQLDSAALISPFWLLPSLSWAQQPIHPQQPVLLPQLPAPAHLREK